MLMTSLEPPPVRPGGGRVKRGEPIGLRVRIMAAVFGSLLIAVGGFWTAMAVWALVERRWDEAREHATLVPSFLFGLLLISSARSGRDLSARGVFAVLRGARPFR